MEFVESCVKDSMPIWEACYNTSFLQQLADGTLDENAFFGYIVDDSVYLREYAKSFACGILKSSQMADVRNFYSMLTFVNSGEDAGRLAYLKHYNVTDATVQSLPQRPDNRAYTDFMLRSSKEGGLPEVMMAILPCMMSYSWLFRRLLAEHPAVQETLFWPLIQVYTTDEYAASCRRWGAYTDALCAGLSQERLDACMKIFHTSSEYELKFWHMSETPREDIKVR